MSMNKEILLVAEILSNEKGVSKTVVMEAIQAALESATKKLSNQDIDVRIEIDNKTGEYETYRVWDVVEDDEVEFPDREISLTDAQLKSPNLNVGDKIEELIPSIAVGRIAAQTARQVLNQKVREAERMLIVEQYKKKMGQIVNGTVKKVIPGFIIVDLGGKAEAFLPRSEMLPHEMFRINDRVRAYLYDVNMHPKGPQLLISRTKNEMLTELFRIEVPEIGENVIQVKAAARDPGNRAKIAVKTNDGRIDPVGACVGMRGARVQAVSSELGGERVDIILWDENPAQLVINAMAPAEISSIIVDEDAHTMDVAVQKDVLSQAIGKNGQNVRLASQLTGWTLNVMSVEDFDQKSQDEALKIIQQFESSLGIDSEIATILAANGFSSIEEIAYVPEEELLSIEEFDNEIVTELRNRANDSLLARALSGEDDEKKLPEKLVDLEGMTPEILTGLIKAGINTIDNLAEHSVDELMGIPGMSEEIAGKLIMNARERWFNE